MAGPVLHPKKLTGIPRLALSHHGQCVKHNFPGLVDENDRSTGIFGLTGLAHIVLDQLSTEAVESPMGGLRPDKRPIPG